MNDILLPQFLVDLLMICLTLFQSLEVSYEPRYQYTDDIYIACFRLRVSDEQHSFRYDKLCYALGTRVSPVSVLLARTTTDGAGYVSFFKSFTPHVVWT